ncbi:MAG: cobyric acid synthase [Anaerolineae bacterium]|nr:cobyric acid synthase [Anaerolineae bacterium]
MTAKTLMIVGTSSSAGKSLLVTALCRIFARRGLRVAPFKAQNMSNNAAVCPDGSEIGRAQATQAAAAGILPGAEMNPILLKPEADARSQVIVMGRPSATLSAAAYYKRKQELWPVVTAALDHLRKEYDLVIIEGAGSPVELNLQAHDIVNLPVALYASAPMLLVGDIDRGGIFAQLLGTTWLLQPAERALLKGYVVNKFRGDPALFKDGFSLLEEKGGVPVVGMLPYLHNSGIPEEDAVALDQPDAQPIPGHQIDIAVIRLPHIANFDDFDSLAAENGVRLRYVTAASAFAHPQAVIIPGTKSTISDLLWLRESGLAALINHAAQKGAAVVGICGGYQMLGRQINDPLHVESFLEAIEGLGLLPHTTEFRGAKQTHRIHAALSGSAGWLQGLHENCLSGYEIHMGQTNSASPWLTIQRRGENPVNVPDGGISPDGRIWGCYIHGLFENENLRRAWLASLGWRNPTPGELLSPRQAYERLANHVEQALDMDLLEKIIGVDF